MNTPNHNNEDDKNDMKKDDIDEDNPYRNNVNDNKDKKDEIEEKEPKKNIFEIDPDKGNISEQIGMDLDFPTRTKILKNMDAPQVFNNAKNLEINNNVPQAMDDFNPYKNEHNDINNNINNNNNGKLF